MDGKPLQGKWCPDSSGFDFFMNRLHRNYSSCDESGQPELLVLSDEVTGHLAGQSRSPSSMSAYGETGILWGLMTTGLATMSNFDVAVTTRRTIGSWGQDRGEQGKSGGRAQGRAHSMRLKRFWTYRPSPNSFSPSHGKSVLSSPSDAATPALSSMWLASFSSLHESALIR